MEASKRDGSGRSEESRNGEQPKMELFGDRRAEGAADRCGAQGCLPDSPLSGGRQEPTAQRLLPGFAFLS